MVVKIINEFFYVKIEGEDQPLVCKLKGTLLKDGHYPYVGDHVELNHIPEEQRGFITQVLPRKNYLQRPAVANIDQVVVVTSAKNPKPNLQLLDRLLIISYFQGLNSIICVNKRDLDEKKAAIIQNYYHNLGYDCVTTSVTEQEVESLKALLIDKVSVLAGQSGVGKSSLANTIIPGLELNTTPVSKKKGTGRQTTRYCQLFPINYGGYLVDTPGFNRRELPDIDPQQLALAFPEMRELMDGCRFKDCFHRHEPGCAVKPEIRESIPERRYQHYIAFLEELEHLGRRF